MADAVRGEQLAQRAVLDVGEGVVGHNAADGDAVGGEERQGALEEARTQMTVVEKKSSAYAQALKEARLESYRQQEVFRAEAVQQRSQILAQGRQGSEQLIGSARTEIQSQVASAKKSLESEVAGMADGIVKGILR